MCEISFMARFNQQRCQCFTVRVGFWVIEQHAIILSAIVRSPTVNNNTKHVVGQLVAFFLLLLLLKNTLKYHQFQNMLH